MRKCTLYPLLLLVFMAFLTGCRKEEQPEPTYDVSELLMEKYWKCVLWKSYFTFMNDDGDWETHLISEEEEFCRANGYFKFNSDNTITSFNNADGCVIDSADSLRWEQIGNHTIRIVGQSNLTYYYMNVYKVNPDEIVLFEQGYGHEYAWEESYYYYVPF